jgi:16S rRNA (uracil1498-N3)-methyltransferase
MGRRWRLHHDPLPAVAGETVELGADEARHVQRVLRLAPGEPIALFDGRGREWAATLETVSPRGVRARLERPIEDPVEPTVAVTLFQAALAPARMDWVVQKAVEVGIAEIRILDTARSERQRGQAARLARWRRIAIESCKQCGRRRVPALADCAELPALAAGSLGLLLDPRAQAAPLGVRLDRPPCAEVWILAGPEAGLDADEAGRFAAAGWERASLGPRILRADTAGLVAATIVLHRWGDLGPSR